MMMSVGPWCRHPPPLVWMMLPLSSSSSSSSVLYSYSFLLSDALLIRRSHRRCCCIVVCTRVYIKSMEMIHMFQRFEDIDMRNKRKKSICWGLVEQSIIIKQTTINTHTHTHTLEILQSRAHNVPNWSGGGVSLVSRHHCPQPSALWQTVPTRYYTNYTLKIDIYTTTHDYIITAETRKKKHERTHTCRVEDSFLLPWP
jgi:hypothetical protein